MNANAKEREGTILLVEDSRGDVLLIEQALLQIGADVRLEVVSDGIAALDYLRTAARLPGLVLMDLNMPKKSGSEILREIRADARFKLLPVVMFTTSNYRSDVARAYGHGANSYVIKPWGQDGLVTVLRRIVEYWFGVVSLPYVE